jgi:poly-gamma-glutamate synthesis protein (capsule biosynthesis protein)
MKKLRLIPIGFLVFSLAATGTILTCAYAGFFGARENPNSETKMMSGLILDATNTAAGVVVAESPEASSSGSSKPVEAKLQAEATFIAVGDIMLSRNVAAKIKKHSDFGYPFASTSVMLRGADFAFGNLESPITPGPTVPTGSFTFHADPGVEKALATANFKILSLANNHLPNYGRKGIEDTIKYLGAAGIAHTGAGKDLAEASAPALFEIKGIKFAFLAYNDSDVVPPGYGAADGRAGTALMDIKNMQTAVSSVKQQADFVIVSMHSGSEYTEEITKSQTEFARAAVDAGAELVLGHHPHVTQRVERYKDKYIFYSLGNFIFDQMWSEETRRGAAVKFYFRRTGLLRAEVMPTRIMDYARPVLAEQKTAEEIFARLRIKQTDGLVTLVTAD